MAASDRLDIATRLRMSAVCSSWAHIIRPRLPLIPPINPGKCIPWLLLSVDASQTQSICTDFTFYHLPSASSYRIPSPIPFSSLLRHHWLGSNSGHLVFLDMCSQLLHLISPLTGTHLLLPSIKLPHIITTNQPNNNPLYHWNTGLHNILNLDSLKKVILCRLPHLRPHPASTTHTSTLLLALGLFWPHGLAVLTVGNDTWTWLDLNRRYKDAIVSRGMIYAMAASTLHCWQLTPSSFQPVSICTIRTSVFDVHFEYLVDVGFRDKLLLVSKERERAKHHCTMRVYELHLHQRDQDRNFVKSIGDHALFLGIGYSRAVSTLGLDGVQGDCIYYVDDDSLYYKFLTKPNTAHDSGIHNLANGTYERYPVADWSPPTWFWPSDIT